MKVLVTGARGFVGQQCAERLHLLSHDVAGVGRTGDAARNIVGRDLATDRLEPLLEGVDVVVHCAGQAHASGGAEADYRRNIVTSTHRLVEALVSTSSGSRRVLVNFSSIKAMAETLAVDSDETTRCVPLTVYGKAKLEAEQIVAGASSSIGTVVSLRPSPVYGPEGRGIIGLLGRLGNKGVLPRIAAKTGIRSYVHVEDVAAAVEACLSLPPGSHTFCLSDGGQYSLADVCGALQKRKPWSPLLPPVGHPLMELGRRGPWGKRLRLDDRLLSDCHVSNALLMQQTDWQPQHRLGSQAGPS